MSTEDVIPNHFSRSPMRTPIGVHKRHRIDVALIVNKMKENRPRRFGHVVREKLEAIKMVMKNKRKRRNLETKVVGFD